MIINCPTKEDFEIVAEENLTQAFTLLFKVFDNYTNYNEDVVREEVPLNDIWNHHRGTLRTSLILLYQAIEGLMKASICQTTPLLLIDKPRKEWPTLPTSENKEFDSLYTVSGESLMNTFCAVNSNIPKTEALINLIEDVRLKRNRAIHGTTISNITPKYIIETILQIFTLWFGKDVWHSELLQNIFDNPLFGYFDSDYESTLSYRFLDFALIILGKASLSNHISVDIKGRKYFCPKCKQSIESEHDTLESKWAFLNPNKPDSTIISCVNCHTNFEVTRQDCIEGNCKGNVQYDDGEYYGGLICLTCFSVREYDKE